MRKWFIIFGFFLSLMVTGRAYGQVYDVACPAGTTVLRQTLNPANGHYKAIECIDTFGNVTNLSTLVGTAGTTSLVQSGIMAEYRILPTESACSIVDYSTNGNNATGCVGTPPSITPVTGGIKFVGSAAVNLPAALNSAQTIQVVFLNLGNTNGGIVAGNGGNANGLILLSTVFQQSVGQITGDSIIQGNARVLGGWLDPGSSAATYPRAVIGGTHVITWDMICDTTHTGQDTIQIDSIDNADFGTSALNTYVNQHCSQGHQTVGNYQLGGVTSASCTSYTGCNFLNSGTIYYAVFYNRPLSRAEVQQNVNFLISTMGARGVTFPAVRGLGANSNISYFPQSISGTMQLAIDGDSLSCGACAGASPNPVAPYSNYLTLSNTNNTSWNIFNQGRVGFRLDFQLLPFAPIAIDNGISPNSSGNVVVIWGGTNDTTVTVNTLAEMQAYCTARRQAGWKCIPVTMISRTGVDSNKNVFNTAMRNNWRTFADGFIDLAADPNLGADGANASATYFTTDHVHVQDFGIINDETWIIQRAVNRLMQGNHDASQATVYASPAAAAVATTAGSEAGNTSTITFTATPANCQVGNRITIAGTTPAGYSGTYLIRTRTPTQVTMFLSTTGLGAITVQGTGVCVQQQDADEYQILNFGAGNYTLQSCQGLTGQNITIQNINGAASTLVPFASETITGAGATPTTLAANTTAILQSQLVSASAAGCNWLRLQ